MGGGDFDVYVRAIIVESAGIIVFFDAVNLILVSAELVIHFAVARFT